MPRGKLRPTLEEVKALLAADQDFLRPLVQAVLQELLEAEMTEALARREGRADAGAARLPCGVLPARAGHPRRQAGAAGAAGPRRSVLDRAVRALSALGEGARGGAGRDVRSRRVDAEGQGDHRRALRPQLLGRGGQRDYRQAGRGPGPIRWPAARRSLPVPDRRRPWSLSSGGLRPTRGSGFEKPA